MTRVRVLLAENHKNMRDIVLRLLEREFEVVGAVQDGRAMVEVATKLEPDICVSDISMPLISGLEAAAELNKNGSTAKLVFLTVHEDPDFVRAAIDVGALGYVIKSRMASDLNSAMRSAMAGRLFISPTCVYCTRSGHVNRTESPSTT